MNCIVPDNIPTIEDHAFALRKRSGKSLVHLLGYMPKDGSLNGNVALLGAPVIFVFPMFSGAI